MKDVFFIIKIISITTLLDLFYVRISNSCIEKNWYETCKINVIQTNYDEHFYPEKLKLT